MKILRYPIIQILACLIMTNFSIGQSTLTVANGAKMKVSSNTTVQNQNLNIGSGSQLINWGDLTVNGVLANNAGTPGLTLKANEYGYGSLMHNDYGVEGTMEQYLISERWHLVSPPVVESTIGIFLDTYFKEWEEYFGSWHYLVQPLNWPIGALHGYAAWADDDLTGSTTIVYEGELISGDAGYNFLSYTENAMNPGWNLIGNPYPSPVEWNTDWWINDMNGWAIVYENGTYKGWNPYLPEGEQSFNGKSDGMLAPGQGFWIHAIGSEPLLSIPQSARSHNNVPFLKSSVKSELQSLHLMAKANGFTDEMAVLFLEDGTTGFDELYELEKHYNVVEAPTIYSVPATQVPTAFNVLPENWIEDTEEPIIPVGFELEEGISCTISSTGLESFDSNSTIFLEDLIEGVIHDLANGDYSFISGDPENPNRFLLHFGNAADNDENNMNSMNIYANKDYVYIRTPDGTSGKAVIFDIMGREIVSFNVEEGLSKQHVYNSGYYIVQVICSEETTTCKVYIN